MSGDQKTGLIIGLMIVVFFIVFIGSMTYQNKMKQEYTCKAAVITTLSEKDVQYGNYIDVLGACE